MNSRLPKTSISALFLSTALVIATALPLQGQSTSYVPALQARDGADLGLALVNPTLSDAKVTLTARDYTGAIIQNNAITNPITLTLPASGQIAVRAWQLFGSGISGQNGWVEVSASTPAVKGVFSAFDSGFNFIELGGFATPASRLIFPKVSGSSATELTLVNTASQDVGATLSLYRNDGQLFSTNSMTIPAFSGFRSSINGLAPSATNFEGYAVIDSGVSPGSGILESLVGFETYGNGSDIALVRALPESSRLRTGFMAHFVSQGGYSTKLTLVNFSGDSQVLRITASGPQVGRGQTPTSATVERTLAPNGRLEERVEQMFNFPGQALVDGYIRFETETNTSGVFGFLDYGTTDGVALSAVEAQGEGYSNLFFSQVAEGASYYTGLALLNPNNESSIVTLDTFDAGGNRTGSTVVNLDPGERVAHLLSEFLQLDVTQFGGYVRITATRPVFALGLFGSSNPPTLASVPAQGESLKPQTSGREVDASLGANVISSDGSTSLLIPSKALTSNASINVAPIDVNGLPSPSGGRWPIAAVEGTPDGTQFQIPVRLTFPVNANLDRGTKIPLLIFDPQTRTYQSTQFVATVDKSGRTASAEVTHFTQYVASISGSLVTISNITPSSVSPGDTITITGSGFCTSRPQTSVTFASASSTSVQGTVGSISATSIQAQVPASAVSGPVTVRSCKQTSTGYSITVASPNPAPGTISITPSSVTTGTTSVTLQIAGTNLMAQSVVYYDSAPIADTFVDSTLLKVTLGALSTAGIHQLYVVNPAPGGGNSNVVSFTVVNPTTTGVFGVSTALQLDKTTVNPGQTLNATVTYKNATSSAVTINNIVIGSRPPGGTNSGGPYADLSPESGVTTVNPGATVTLSASRTFTSSDPTGTWYAFATYQDSASVWHDGPSVNFTVSLTAPTNQAPVVNAGPDQTITLPSSASLNGTATDDGLPAGSTLMTTWSKFSGPGTVTFGNANALNTTATFSASGAYVLRLTATDSVLSSSNDIAITVNPVATTTTGVFGMSTALQLDKTTVNPGQTLNATVTYKNGTGSAVTINDIVIAGRPPAGTNSGGPYADLSPESGLVTVAAGATVTLSASRTFTSSDPTGTWYAFATYQDSALVWHDGPNVNFTVSTTTTTTSTPPVVSAGSNQTITLPASATLNGTASGSGTVTTAWSKFSGPGTVTFGNANALSTTASFSTSGSYMLQLTGTNAYGTSSSTVTITVNPTGTGTTSTPVVNAGGDQTITLPATASLSGTATGFPSGSTLTQTWSKFGGTGTVTFSSTTSLATVATFSTSGSYTLRLTVTGGGVTATDDTIITVNPAPTSGPAFYVSTSGNDSNSGSSSSPWRTIQKAANSVSGGTTVIVAPGKYDERVTVSNSGSSGKLIVFQGQSGAVMRGFTINGNYIQVTGFEITHSPSVFSSCNNDDDTNGAGVYMGGSNIQAVSNFIHDTARSGALVFGSNNIVRNNTITTAAFDGIWLQGSNQLAEGNDISGTIANPGSCLWSNIPSWYDANGIEFEGDAQTIRGNRIHDINGWDSRNSLTPHSDGVQMSWGSSSGTIIEKNDISIPKWSGYCEQIGMFNGTITNLMIRNNVVHDTCRGFNFVATVNGIQIVNNTFVNLDDYGTELDGSVSNPVVQNNIYYNITHPYLRLGSVSSPTVGNNLAYQVQGSAFSGDLWGVDPQFVNVSGKDFHIKSTSPAKDRGLMLSNVKDDRDGTPRPQGSADDIGGYEYH